MAVDGATLLLGHLRHLVFHRFLLLERLEVQVLLLLLFLAVHIVQVSVRTDVSASTQTSERTYRWEYNVRTGTDASTHAHVREHVHEHVLVHVPISEYKYVHARMYPYTSDRHSASLNERICSTNRTQTPKRTYLCDGRGVHRFPVDELLYLWIVKVKVTQTRSLPPRLSVPVAAAG